MKNLLLILIISTSLTVSFAQQKDSIRQIVDEDKIYNIDSVVVSKQRFITAKGFTKDDNGKILPDVIITHGSGKKQRKTISDKDGYFSLDSVKASNRLIRFTKKGYTSLLYKADPYQMNNIRLAFDPNSSEAEYDLSYFKESKFKSTQRVKVIQGETLRHYANGGRLTNVLPALLGFYDADKLGLIILNNMRIPRTKAEPYSVVLNNINSNEIAAIAFVPSYSSSNVLFGFGGNIEGAGTLIIKLKSKN